MNRKTGVWRVLAGSLPAGVWSGGPHPTPGSLTPRHDGGECGFLLSKLFIVTFDVASPLQKAGAWGGRLGRGEEGVWEGQDRCESRSSSVSLGQTCLSLVLTSRALVARGTVILGCSYKDLISCWLLEPADQLRSRKGSPERWRWHQYRAVSHLRAWTVGWPPPLCSEPRLPLLQNRVVQVVVRDEGMENQTERNPRPSTQEVGAREIFSGLCYH